MHTETFSRKLAGMKAYRAALLRFADNGSAQYEADGLLVIGPNAAGRDTVLAVGAYADLQAGYAQVPTEHLPGRILAPGFVDLHIHYPQVDVIGAPAAGLLPWLENYTFPHEKRFFRQDYAADVAQFFIAELLRNGVTTPLTFATSHPASVDALFLEAQKHNLRLITGKVLQDRHSPDGVRDDTEQSLIDTEQLIQHVAENKDEIAWVHQLFPASRSYLSVYDDFGLLRQRAIYAHCIHFDEADRALMLSSGAAAAISPTSNLFLGSGFFDYVNADKAGFAYGLASDVGGGTSFSPFHTMLAAYYVGREGQTKHGLSVRPQQLWWQHTAGAAAALGLQGVVGNLQPGCEADFIVIKPDATPLLARKTAQANNLDELLFALIVLGDDRLIERTVIAQG